MYIILPIPEKEHKEINHEKKEPRPRKYRFEEIFEIKKKNDKKPKTKQK